VELKENEVKKGLKHAGVVVGAIKRSPLPARGELLGLFCLASTIDTVPTTVATAAPFQIQSLQQR
jgi:hypothetical protein